MRIKLDEILPREVRDLVEGRGLDVKTALDQKLGGSQDSKVAAAVREEGRVLVTLDHGFGDIRTYPPSEFAGIIVLRLARQEPDYLLPFVERVLVLLEAEETSGELWIVEEAGIRRRR